MDARGEAQCTMEEKCSRKISCQYVIRLLTRPYGLPEVETLKPETLKL